VANVLHARTVVDALLHPLLNEDRCAGAEEASDATGASAPAPTATGEATPGERLSPELWARLIAPLARLMRKAVRGDRGGLLRPAWEEAASNARRRGHGVSFGRAPIQLAASAIAPSHPAWEEPNACGDPERPLHRGAAVCPVKHVLGRPLVQELVLQEQGDDPLTEAAAHLLEIDPGDVDEPALRDEAPLEE
jgi:hypothetical protein